MRPGLEAAFGEGRTGAMGASGEVEASRVGVVARGREAPEGFTLTKSLRREEGLTLRSPFVGERGTVGR